MSSNLHISDIKSEVADLEARIPNASSKDEALDLALKAAELCMKALKLASDKSQKSDISSRCQSLLTEAERIKKTNEWASSLPPSSSFIPTTPLSQNSSLARGSLSERLAIKSSDTPPKTKRSTPPIPNRNLSTSEQILLLKGSRLNGQTYPPWKGDPEPSEFTLDYDEGPFTDKAILNLSSHQLASFDGWRRAKDALPPPTWFPGKRDGLGPIMSANHSIDLVQDAATDCSVVASLCAGVARTERGNEKLLSSFIWPFDDEKMAPKISDNGKYILRLNFNGCWRKVVIDDRLPVSKSSRMLHVIDRKNPALLWPVLLEKAYLKVRGGYDFPGSSSCTDLWMLIGWLPEQIFLQDEEVVSDEVWTRLFSAFGFGDLLMTVGTGNMSNRVEKELGLEGQHDYAVLNMREVDGEKQLLLKNPWAEGKGWRGVRKESFATENATPPPNLSASKSSDGTFPFLPRSSQDPDHLEPGTFWINLEHVFQHFESIYVNWNPALFKYRQDIHFSWDLASLPSIPTCFINNPQFSLSTTDDTPIWLLLSRHFKEDVSGVIRSQETSVNSEDSSLTTLIGDTDHSFQKQANTKDNGMVTQVKSEKSGLSDLAHGFISLYIFDQAGNRVYTSNIETIERGAFVSTAQMLLKWKKPSKGTFTVVVEQMELPRDLYTFSLSVFALKPIKLDHATSQYGQTTKLESSWNKATAGGNLQSPTFSENPQFSLKVPQNTSLAILLQVPSSVVVSNVVLLHGQGKRVYSVKNRDIIANSGVYKKHCAFAELRNIDPGTYTIACSTFEAGQEAKFELRVDSNVQCELKAIPQEGAGLVRVKLADAQFPSTASMIAAPIVPRKLTRVTIVARFSRAYSSYDNPQRSNRSPLRVTLELGRGPSRRILIASGDGEYGDSEAGVRTEEIDLNPGMLQGGDMWLALDRLSGPSSGFAEVYKVELFCDTPNALEVGVWRSFTA
ncbi:uncharacterized protein K452DRAFT_356752 [Aplosporella prunicola CBS 121167]|uniref:Calpain catalytic domain-containing protein n=1 Tax=Aplosporella prunicola CBS 121167 TaxID=1176127 RepID=A0A6A6BP19_9PEZI|nr:uncharacterized protein K452DRAFT_356752 [Aplosporella prunicola CBS 121167]KAF2144597.1 hypothetical protein K452DRAFT_356752 [Aplosporella prunicola CBS 121167]